MKPELYPREGRHWFGPANRRVGSVMDLHPRLSSWIGLCAALAGLWLLFNPPEDDLLPINQVLLAFNCALSVAWVLVLLTRGQG